MKKIESMPIELMYWGYSRARSTIDVPLHAHQYWQSCLTLSGCCLFTAGRTVYTLGAGDILFLPPEIPHKLVYPETAAFESYSFKFNLDAPDIVSNVIYLPSDVHTRAIIKAVDVLVKADFPPEKIHAETGSIVMNGDRFHLPVEALLGGVLRGCFGDSAAQGISGALRSLIRKSKGAPLQVETAAHKLGFSRNHFSLLVKQDSGLSAKEFIDRERLEIARRYLEYSNFNISEIAERMGFRDVFYFGTFFKRRTGMSPGQFRREWRK